MTFETYLDELASAAPTPGGGSAATVVAALGAALVAMVARITRANTSYAPRHALADELALKADGVRAHALAAREHDEAAYGKVVAAMALPKANRDEKMLRTATLQAALGGAAAAPLHTAEIAKRVAILTERALALENQHLASDLGCAAEFASSALAAAAWNVRVNHKFMKDQVAIDRQEGELARYERETALLVKRVRFEVARTVAR